MLAMATTRTPTPIKILRMKTALYKREFQDAMEISGSLKWG
jgi:hypothetical protein